MDLQAILDAGSSSSSSSSDDYARRRGAPMTGGRSRPTCTSRGQRGGGGGGHLRHGSASDRDLERILRVDSDEDTDENDDDDDDEYRDLYGGGMGKYLGGGAAANASPPRSSPGENTSVGGTTISTLTRHQLPPTTGRPTGNGGTGAVVTGGGGRSPYPSVVPTTPQQTRRGQHPPDAGDECITPIARSGPPRSSSRSAASAASAAVPQSSSVSRDLGGGFSITSAGGRTSHSAEDWAVLQSILDDADDSDGDDSDENNDGRNEVNIDLSVDYSSRVRRAGSGYAASAGSSATGSSSRRGGSDNLAHLLGRIDGGAEQASSYATPSKAGAARPSIQSRSTQSSLASSINPDVDAILRSMNEEDDDDDDDEDDTSISDGYVFNFGDDTKKTAAAPTSKDDARSAATSVRSAYDMPKTTSFDRSRYDAILSSASSSRRGGVDSASGRRSEEKKETSSPLSPKDRYGGSGIGGKGRSTPEYITAAYLRHAKNVEQKLLRPGQRDIVSPLMVKRRMKPKIELTSSKNKGSGGAAGTSTGQDGDSIAASAAAAHLPGTTSSASVVASKPLAKIGKELLMNSRERKHSVGLPTALAVSSKFIAVGTQKGQVLVFDHFEVLKLRLGRSSSASSSGAGGPELSPSAGSVTTIDLSHDGDALVAGYTSGLIVLWDAIRGTILKSVGDAHPSPVTSVRFLPRPDALSVVTVDAGGLVNRLNFSKMVLWGTYTVETECLLDGTAGQILATHVLPPPPPMPLNVGRDDEASSGLHPGFKKLVLVALSSDRSTFTVAVEPSVNVLYRWGKPAEDLMNVDSFIASLISSNPADEDGPENSESTSPAPTPHTFLPCISWGWSQIQGGGKAVTPVLARAWGCAVQFIHASFPDSDGDVDDLNGPGAMQWPAFGDYNEFQSSAPVVALEWLGERSLVYLTVTNEFTIVDTVMMTLIERLDFSVVKLVYAEFSLSRAASTPPPSGGSSSITVRSQCLSTTFQNSIRSAEGRILILCQEDLLAVSNLGIKQRVSTLEEDGEWLEALALALDHYESTVKSLEDRRRVRDGDLSRHPEFARGGQRSEEEEWIAALLLRYMNLAVENAPEPIRDNSFGSASRGKQQSRFIDLAHGHFQMLAGVCIDFCVVTRRLDLLFGPVFDCFKSAEYVSVFFDVLEPYVLNDKLDYIAPEAMTYFIEHCRVMNDLAVVERCLLHMNVTFMDFDSILSLLRANGMYTALLHVYGRGLDDFATPLAELYEALFDEADGGNVQTYRRPDGIPQNLFEQYGYKAIVYIQFCLEGKMFPQGSALEPSEKVQAVRHEILQFLQEETYAPPPTIRRGGSATLSVPMRSMRRMRYPYLQLLVSLDTKALLDTLSIFFDEPDVTANGRDSGIEAEGLCPDCQELASILSQIIMPENDEADTTGLTKKTKHKDAFLDFVAKYLLKGTITVSVPVTMEILTRMSSLVMTSATSSHISAAQREAQTKVLELLEALPRNCYDHKKALKIVEDAGLNRAALLLHRESLMALLQSGASRGVITHHFCSSIDCYLKDSDRDYRALVFDYIKNDCMSSIVDSTVMYQDESDSGPVRAKDLLKEPILGKLPALINLDAVQSTQLVTELFIEDLDEIIASLEGRDTEIALFNFFHAIVSGSLSKADPVAGPALLANLTPAHHQTYLVLMARYHPEMMYHHLSTHDNYRVEDCLKLCQEYEIADASAYLLERMGNVSSALQLMLQTLEAHLMTLKRVVRSAGSDTASSRRKGGRISTGTGSSRRSMVAVLATSEDYKKEVQKVKQSLVVALDLCERNSGESKARSDHGSQLWFNILDRLTNAKGFLRLHKEEPANSAVMLTILSELLELSMQRMVSCVPLTDLLKKITTDHSGSTLGEFREMLATLLKTYNTELKLCSRAADVVNSDVNNMSAEKRRLKLRGHRIESLADDACDVVLIDDASGGTFNGQSESEASNLSRLRAKRNRRAARQGYRRGRSSLALLPNAEPSQPAHFGQRPIGRLSHADHFGRLE